MSTSQVDGVNSLPSWLNLLLAAFSGSVIATGIFVRWMWTLSDRIQRIENQDLDKIIDTRISADRHDNLYPMLQVRIFGPLDKIEDEQKMQGQNIAVLLERDRTGAAMEKIVASLTSRHPA